MAKNSAFDEKYLSSVRSLVRKGMQFRKPCDFKVSLRPELLDFLEQFCDLPEISCGVTVLVRGILEDFYDKNLHLIPASEVDLDA